MGGGGCSSGYFTVYTIRVRFKIRDRVKDSVRVGIVFRVGGGGDETRVLI